MYYYCRGFQDDSVGKENLPPMQETLVQSLNREDLLQKPEASHSSVLGRPVWLSWYFIEDNVLL